jgi:hypothetical protein
LPMKRPSATKSIITRKPIKDFSNVKVVMKYGQKQLTGDDPVLLGLIKKAVAK